MDVPIQAQPAIRTAVAGRPAHGGDRVFPQQCSPDNCVPGCWCCSGPSGANPSPSCYNCNTGPLCTVTQLAFCQAMNLHVSDECIC
jgi:hypothetical protein